MTLDQIELACREQHNAVGDSNWGTQEIYTLLTKRCNRVLSVIGLRETTSTDTSVASTQTYDMPTNAVHIHQVDYKYDRLQQISFREWDAYRSDSGTSEGLPDKWFPWERKIYLVNVPDTSGDTITIYHNSWQPYIDSTDGTTYPPASYTTLVPEELHDAIIDGVIGDMFVKDLNVQMAKLFESKWENIHVPRLYAWKQRDHRGSKFKTIADSDTLIGTELGIS